MNNPFARNNMEAKLLDVNHDIKQNEQALRDQFARERVAAGRPASLFEEVQAEINRMDAKNEAAIAALRKEATALEYKARLRELSQRGEALSFRKLKHQEWRIEASRGVYARHENLSVGGASVAIRRWFNSFGELYHTDWWIEDGLGRFVSSCGADPEERTLQEIKKILSDFDEGSYRFGDSPVMTDDEFLARVRSLARNQMQ